MVNRSIAVVAAALFCISIFSFGCKKTCSSVTCRTYGFNAALQAYANEVCANGVCYCPNGLEGDSCQKFSLLKYLQPSATWQVADACSGNSTYYVNMSYNSGVTQYNNVFYINGLFNLGQPIEADIVSNASHQGINLNIPQQTVGSVTVYGQGFYQVNSGLGKITLNLDYNQSGVESNCTLILYQQ